MEYLGKPAEPLPQVIHLKNMVLVLSGKRDVYYTVTSGKCSCPSSTYRPGKPCKHQRKYYPGPEKSPVEIERESDEVLARLQKAKWVGGFNGPREISKADDWAEAITGSIQNPEAAPAVSSLMLLDDYAPLTTEDEISYWQKKAKQDQEA